MRPEANNLVESPQIFFVIPTSAGGFASLVSNVQQFFHLPNMTDLRSWQISPYKLFKLGH